MYSGSVVPTPRRASYPGSANGNQQKSETTITQCFRYSEFSGHVLGKNVTLQRDLRKKLDLYKSKEKLEIQALTDMQRSTRKQHERLLQRVQQTTKDDDLLRRSKDKPVVSAETLFFSPERSKSSSQSERTSRNSLNLTRRASLEKLPDLDKSIRGKAFITNNSDRTISANGDALKTASTSNNKSKVTALAVGRNQFLKQKQDNTSPRRKSTKIVNAPRKGNKRDIITLSLTGESCHTKPYIFQLNAIW